MKLVKGSVLVAASLTLVLSVAPMFGQFQKDPEPDTEGGGSNWTVVCEYDGTHGLLRKTCTSGGNVQCSCP